MRFVLLPVYRFAQFYSTADRSMVCCSIFPANFSHFATALIFLWSLSFHQGKESDELIRTEQAQSAKGVKRGVLAGNER